MPAGFSQHPAQVVHAYRNERGWQVDKFKKNLGKMFTGTGDAMEAYYWLTDTRDTLMTMGCPTTFWTRIAVAALQGAAKSWWHSVALTAFPGEPLNTISWDNFRHVFVFRYLPPEAIKEKELEFLTLT